MDTRKVLACIILLLALTSIIYASSASHASREVRIQFRIYDMNGASIGYSDVVINVRVKALYPPPGDPVIVANATVNNGVMVLGVDRDLGDIVGEWSRFEAMRLGYSSLEEGLSLASKSMESTRRALVVEAHVLSLNGTLLGRFVKYLPYSPVALYTGSTPGMEYIVDIRLNTTLRDLKEMNRNPGIREYFPCDEYYWQLDWRIDAEDISSTNPYIPQLSVNGVMYVAVPLLLVENEDLGPQGPPLDGVFHGNIEFEGVYTVSFKVGLGIAPQIIYKALLGQWDGGLSGNIGFSAGSSKEDRIQMNIPFSGIEGGETAVVYFYGRPVIEFYREVYRDWCSSYEEYTGYERLDVYIEDIHTDEVAPGGDVKIVYPEVEVSNGSPQWVGDLLSLYGYTYTFRSLTLPSGTLSDGVLQSGEGVYLEYVYTYLDSNPNGCEDFDVTIPVGLSIALTASRTIPALGPLTLILTLAVDFEASAQGSSEVEGSLYNWGDVSEYIKAGFGNIEYRKDPPAGCFWCSTCYYQIPMLYIKGR